MRKTIVLSLLAVSLQISAQTYNHYTTTEGKEWQQSHQKLSGKAATEPVLIIVGNEQGHEFRAWGTCFNELDLDALELLKAEEQEEVMRRLFDPNGDLKFTRGRLTMNANDYSRGWYSCDTVAGDFALKYFNIEHDKKNVIRLIRKAQKYQPQMTFWVSPWSPPAWMKINQDYPVMSSKWNKQQPEKDYLLFGGGKVDETEVMLAGQQKGLFPKRLATQDYFIQEPRYLQAYADMFCKFIDLYAAENIPIDMVMYQNEAYSYTAYPGCAWTAEGTLRFNRDYLIPTMKKNHPEVEVNIGTLNTNRFSYVTRFIDGLHTPANSQQLTANSPLIKAVGLQWEGRQIIDSLRKRYPGMRFISTESECGNGRMDWRAGEHTFHLLADYIGRGCDEYFIWNFILCNNGSSPWGWKQNALIQVNTQGNAAANSPLSTLNYQLRFTPEFYAVKHFSNLVTPGSRMQGYVPREQTKGLPIIVFQRPDKKYVVIAGNQTNEQRIATVKLGKKFLNMTLRPHSFNSYISK
jgi:glucosylceramidase